MQDSNQECIQARNAANEVCAADKAFPQTKCIAALEKAHATCDRARARDPDIARAKDALNRCLKKPCKPPCLPQYLYLCNPITGDCNAVPIPQ